MGERRVNGGGSPAETNLEGNAFGYYLDQVGRVPLPDHGEQLAMARNVQASLAALKAAEEENAPDELAEARAKAGEAISEMVLRNLRLVPSTAKRRKIRAAGVDFFDLIQGGNLGLVRAVELFDPERGNTFSTYATDWIVQGMQRTATKMSAGWRKPQTVVLSARRIMKTHSRLEQTLKGTPTLAETAEAAYIDPCEAERILLLEGLVYLDMPLGDEADSQTVGDLIGSNRHDPAAAAMESDMRQTIDRLLDYLDEPEGLILRLRFGFDGSGVLSLTEVSRITGLSREWVRRLEKRALKKLRQQHGKQLHAYLR